MQQQAYLPSKYVAAIIGIFLGGLGLHHFYLGRNNSGIVWLLACIFLSWTVVVPVGLAVIGFFQGVSYLFWNEENWARVHTRIVGPA